MSVVRAILGRFARFLVRIARTLDPGLASAPYWVMPERMAALRQRYPGAPEHWLEFVARRAAVGGAADPPSAPPESRPPIEAQQPGTRSRTRLTMRNLLRVRERPAVAFPRPDARAKARPAGPRIAARADPGPQAAPSPAIRSTRRPGLTFSTKAVRNPIANLLRIRRPEGRAAALHFHADNPVDRENLKAPEREELARREHQTFFPEPGIRPARRPELVGAVDAYRDTGQSELRWPDRPEPPSTAPSWLDGRPGSVRPDPSFRAHDPRWPELPRGAVEIAPSPTPSLDEAILLAEQIGGTWSG